jgi:hypothetical protein
MKYLKGERMQNAIEAGHVLSGRFISRTGISSFANLGRFTTKAGNTRTGATGAVGVSV